MQATPAAMARSQPADTVVTLEMATGEARASHHQSALLGLPTHLHIPMAHPLATGRPSLPQMVSRQDHGALEPQLLAGKRRSPEALEVDPASVQELAVSSAVVDPDLSATEVGVRANSVNPAPGLLVHGQAGGTATAAHPPTGLAGPLAAGAHLPLGPPGLAALLQSLPPASTPPSATARHTQPLASVTNSLK